MSAVKHKILETVYMCLVMLAWATVDCSDNIIYTPMNHIMMWFAPRAYSLFNCFQNSTRKFAMPTMHPHKLTDSYGSKCLPIICFWCIHNATWEWITFWFWQFFRRKYCRFGNKMAFMHTKCSFWKLFNWICGTEPIWNENSPENTLNFQCLETFIGCSAKLTKAAALHWKTIVTSAQGDKGVGTGCMRMAFNVLTVVRTEYSRDTMGVPNRSVFHEFD